MQEDISQAEYRKLLIGLGGDTPLGNVIRVRSETDKKTISQMTAHEKQIRRDWDAFRAKRAAAPETQAANMQAMAALLRNLFG